MLDAFDFFLVVMTLTAIAKEFHKSDAAIALSITLTPRLPARCASSSLPPRRSLRPQDPVEWSILVFYSIIEVLSGLAAELHHLPYPARLVRDRHGRGVGRGRVARSGEGAAATARRHVGPAPARVCAGYLLAALCYLLVFPMRLRPLFFIGGLPALLALFVRARVQESRCGRQTRVTGLVGLGRAIASNWKLVPLSDGA